MQVVGRVHGRVFGYEVAPEATYRGGKKRYHLILRVGFKINSYCYIHALNPVEPTSRVFGSLRTNPDSRPRPTPQLDGWWKEPGRQWGNPHNQLANTLSVWLAYGSSSPTTQNGLNTCHILLHALHQCSHFMLFKYIKKRIGTHTCIVSMHEKKKKKHQQKYHPKKKPQ